MRAFYTDQAKNSLYFSKRTAGRVETVGEHSDWCRWPLTLPSFIKFHPVALADQVRERHSQTSSTTCSLLKPP